MSCGFKSRIARRLGFALESDANAAPLRTERDHVPHIGPCYRRVSILMSTFERPCRAGLCHPDLLALPFSPNHHNTPKPRAANVWTEIYTCLPQLWKGSHGIFSKSEYYSGLKSAIASFFVIVVAWPLAPPTLDVAIFEASVAAKSDVITSPSDSSLTLTLSSYPIPNPFLLSKTPLPSALTFCLLLFSPSLC